VFQSLSGGGKHFGEAELREVLKRMGSKMTKAEIERMLWEFDEDLNRKISEKEFLTMYKKCTIDPAAAESKNLFHLTQFLMYCRPGNYRITVEDTLELLFVRAKLHLQRTGRTEEKEIIRKLEHEIDVIFEGEEKTVEGLEKEITFEEYLTRISRRAIEKRRRQIEKAKSALKYGAQPIDDDDN
jgi:Ca2+-binding EF-hand superfamily protein